MNDEKFINTQEMQKEDLEVVFYEREPIDMFGEIKPEEYSDFMICEIRLTQ